MPSGYKNANYNMQSFGSLVPLTPSLLCWAHNQLGSWVARGGLGRTWLVAGRGGEGGGLRLSSEVVTLVTKGLVGGTFA